jgi:hypothetical protein
MDPASLDRDWLGRIAEDAFFSDPRLYRDRLDYQPSIVEDMLGSSPLLDYVRQRLPHKVADTAAGQWLERKAADLPQGGLRQDLIQQVQDLPGGGYDPEYLDLIDQMRAEDPLVRRNTVRNGLVATPDGLEEIPIGDSTRAGAAQLAGVSAADAASDGLRNIWWFLNAPQAVASLAVLQALHAPAKAESARIAQQLGDQLGPEDRVVSPFASRRTRLAAAVPAVIGMSLAIGNAMRQPGYKAALPSEADPTQTADPLGELGARYVLGRTGELLAYDDFVKERPDVSKGEYDAYKAYLYGSASPIKASLDGINGPEVNFMGKSIPILTGIAPTIAAVVGSHRGMRKAMDRLRYHADGDQLLAAEQARVDYRKAERESRMANADKHMGDDPQKIVNDLKESYATLQRDNEKEILKQTLLGSAKYMAPTAILGQTLESIRRSLPREQPPEPEPEPKAKPKLKPELVTPAAAPAPLAP